MHCSIKFQVKLERGTRSAQSACDVGSATKAFIRRGGGTYVSKFTGIDVALGASGQVAVWPVRAAIAVT